MRSTTTTAVNLIKLGVLGVMSVVFFAPAPSAMAGQAMMATLNPVNKVQDRVDEGVNYGTAKFTQGSSKVDVLMQAAGIPLGGREPEGAGDGEPATVGFKVRIVKSADCATADTAATLAELPQLRIKSDGSGILMASTDKVSLEQIAGHAVVVSSPNTRVACGVIKAE